MKLEMTNHKLWESDPNILDEVWRNWNCQVDLNPQIFQAYYTDVKRSTQRAQRFEDWLYDHGAFVIQKNHRRFLRFYKEEDAVMFMLRWT